MIQSLSPCLIHEWTIREYYIPKPSLKIRTARAIFWNYLGIFRDYGLKNILFRNKTFSFFKVESWNFQHLFEIEFPETSQNFNSFSLFRQLLFSFFLYRLSDWVEIWGLTISNRCWKFSFLSRKTNKFCPLKDLF